jgi:hypothetical protein
MKLYFVVKNDAVFSILRRFGRHMKGKYTKNEEDAVDSFVKTLIKYNSWRIVGLRQPKE